MKHWNKIEIFLNTILGRVLTFLRMCLTKTTPVKIQEICKKIFFKIQSFSQSIRENTKSSPKSSSIFLKKINTKIQAVVLQLKSKKDSFFKTVKSIDPKKVSLAKIGIFVLAIIGPVTNKLKIWWISLKPTTMLGFVLAGSITSLASINIYKSSKDIAEKSEQRRSPASVQEAIKKKTGRPTYYKLNERQFTVLNINIPVYVRSNRNQLKSIKVDFTITSSNRYIREFLNKNFYLVEDKIISTTHPIIPQFPLKSEGKTILKNKITKELQNLIDSLEIKGSIQSVHIHSTLAG